MAHPYAAMATQPGDFGPDRVYLERCCNSTGDPRTTPGSMVTHAPTKLRFLSFKHRRALGRKSTLMGPARKPLATMITKAWMRARERAADKWAKLTGYPAPEGFRTVRVHDLKHYLPCLTMSGGAGDTVEPLGNFRLTRVQVSPSDPT